MTPVLEQLESRLTPTAILNHGGPVLAHPQISNIYAGGSTYEALSPVAAGDYAALAAPYGVGPGAYLGSTTVPNPGTLSNAGMQALIAKEIASGAVPQPGPYSLYMVSLAQPVTDSFAASFVAYHSWFTLPDGQAVVYGVVWPSAVGSLSYTHEVIEAATDPFASAWYGAGGLAQECADVEAWQSFVLDGQAVCQFALPDGSPAGKTQPTPVTPVTPAALLGNLFSLAVERLRADVFGLLARVNPAFAPQSDAAARAVTADPLHGTPPGQWVEAQVDAVFVAWLSGQK